MPEFVLNIIPTDPGYIPAPAAQQMAFALFSSFVNKADDLGILVTDTAIFLDAGKNFESVVCPACGTELNEWWQTTMQNAYDNQFTDLEVEVPCCGARGSLNDLTYTGPAGFASFRLWARNPVADLDDSQLGLLAGVIKCDLRKITTYE